MLVRSRASLDILDECRCGDRLPASLSLVRLVDLWDVRRPLSSLAGGSLAALLEAAEVKQELLSPPQEDDSPVRKWRKLHQNGPSWKT